MDIKKLFEQVKNGEIEPHDAVRIVRDQPFEDLGFAKLDHHRELRTGFGEVVYCPGKTNDQLIEIMRRFNSGGTGVLGTRATEEQFRAAAECCPGAEYDAVSRILKIMPKWRPEPVGLVAVCTGGTGDMSVAEEAAQTAEFFGSRVQRFYDVGVAGIHRLLSNINEIRGANAIVAVAGMEGALAGVIAGLVEAPVIAVPTSVGYGASFNGISPLLTMLNSCAEGVAVVNIDNGFGGGYMACSINRAIERKAQKI